MKVIPASKWFTRDLPHFFVRFFAYYGHHSRLASDLVKDKFRLLGDKTSDA